MDMNLIKEFAQLETEKNELDSKLKDIKKRLDEIAPIIMEQMQTNEINNIKTNGRTVFIQRAIYAKKLSDTLDTINALKAAGWHDYVAENCNLNQISARMRELDRDGEDLPAEFDGILEKNVIFKVKSLKSA